MGHARVRSRFQARRGSTLVELIIGLVLTVFLLSLVGTTWASMNRAAAEVHARYELVLEADLAFTRLSDDLRFAGSESGAGRQILAGPNLLQIVDGARIVTYEAADGLLYRLVESSEDPPEVIARHIDELSVQSEGDDPVYRIQLTGSYPVPGSLGSESRISRTFQLLAVLP